MKKLRTLLPALWISPDYRTHPHPASVNQCLCLDSEAMVLLLMGICDALEDKDLGFWRCVDRSDGYQAYWPRLGGTTGGYGVFTPTGREGKSHEAHSLAYRYCFAGIDRLFRAGEFLQWQFGTHYSVSSPAGCYS
jgi:hypothetical protein